MLSFRADGVEIRANCTCLAVTFADFNSYSEVLGSATQKTQIICEESTYVFDFISRKILKF